MYKIYLFYNVGGRSMDTKNLDFSYFDSNFYVNYRPNCELYPLMIYSKKDHAMFSSVKEDGDMSVSEAYRLAKERNLFFGCEESKYKESYYLCEKLNNSLGTYSVSVESLITVGRDLHKPWAITNDMNRDQKEARIMANFANGFINIMGTVIDGIKMNEDYLRFKNEHYAELR